MAIVTDSLPPNVVVADRGGLVGRAHSVKDTHESCGVINRTAQPGTGFPSREEIVEQVDPAEGEGASTPTPVHLNGVRLIGQLNSALSPVDKNEGGSTPRSTQSEPKPHPKTIAKGDNPGGSVVPLDVIGPIEIGFHPVNLIEPSSPRNEQCSGDSVGKRIGNDPVDDVTPIKPTPPSPSGTSPVPSGAHPSPKRTKTGYRPDLPVGDDPPNRLDSGGTKRLETNLTKPPSLPNSG